MNEREEVLRDLEIAGQRLGNYSRENFINSVLVAFWSSLPYVASIAAYVIRNASQMIRFYQERKKDLRQKLRTLA